jgi:hypothetical protein
MNINKDFITAVEDYRAIKENILNRANDSVLLKTIREYFASGFIPIKTTKNKTFKRAELKDIYIYKDYGHDEKLRRVLKDEYIRFDFTVWYEIYDEELASDYPYISSYDTMVWIDVPFNLVRSENKRAIKKYFAAKYEVWKAAKILEINADINILNLKVKEIKSKKY